MDKYVKLTLEKDDYVYVSEESLKEYKTALRNNEKPEEIVKKLMRMMLSSDDAINKMYEKTRVMTGVIKLKDVKLLKSLRDIIDNRIDALEKTKSDKNDEG